MEENELLYKIYCYVCLVNQKKYVGQTYKSLEERAGKNGSGYRGCKAFYNAIQKYGWDNFSPIVLEDGLTLEQANEREQYWIKELSTLAPDGWGYNLVKGGDNREFTPYVKQKISEATRQAFQREEVKEHHSLSLRGRKLSEKTKEALKKAHTGRTCSEETKRKISQSKRGKKATAEAIEKNRQVHLGLRHTEETLKKMKEHSFWKGKTLPDNIRQAVSKAHKGIPLSEEQKIKIRDSSPKKVQVKQLTLDGQLIRTYDSQGDAERQTGINRINICQCCKGTRKSAGGYHWEYGDTNCL